MDYRVMLSGRAERDLEDIVRFLAQKNPVVAERLGYALLDDALSLANLPRRGLTVPERPGEVALPADAPSGLRGRWPVGAFHRRGSALESAE